MSTSKDNRLSRWLTKVEGYPDKWSAVPGMAYFAGTGPLFATCGKCEFQNSSRRCEKYKEMKGEYGPKIFEGHRACKYFADRRPGAEKASS
jgi:hypothetical protein